MAKELKYDVFISYSRKDYIDKRKNVIPNNEISKIKEALTNAGITYWFDEEYVRSGAEFAKVIIKNIKTSSIFIFISTHNSNNGDWTANEIASAYMIGKKIIPVRLDNSIYHDDVLLYIARLNHIDYNDNPEKGRQELINSIKSYLEEERENTKLKEEEIKAKENLLKHQQRQQIEEQERQKKVSDLESKISAKESLRSDLKKVVTQKEYDLKVAQDEFDECEREIRKLQDKLLSLGGKVIVSAHDEIIEMKLSDTIKFNMIRVEGGTFTMGATGEQGDDVGSAEKPPHKVTLSDYYIGETVVTQELWQAVMGNNPSSFKGNNLPVESVAWEHRNENISIKMFIRKLNEMLQNIIPQGHRFRLPTEAEWEFAARERKNACYKYSGSNNIDDVAWYLENSDRKTHPVKAKKPNALGIYDMSGNVWEWCQDRWDKYSGVIQDNPKGPDSGSFRVYRGGCCGDSAKNCRVSYRYRNIPAFCSNVLGFRLAL